MNFLISDTVDSLQIEVDEEHFFEKDCEQSLLSPEDTDESGFFEDVISVSSGKTKLPAGTESLIATESDIDLTAQLVPSGGFQNHSCVTTHPISETEPQADCKFKYTFSCSPCIYTEAVPMHSIQSSDYRIHHTPTGHDCSKTQYEETPSRGTSFVKTLASSTVPFSLGTSPNPGLVKGNLSAGNVQGSGGQLNGVRPDNTMDGGDRALVQVPTSETESNQNENFTKEPERTGIFPQAPKYEDWLVGENEEELYCEAGECDGVDLYTDPSKMRDKPVGGSEEVCKSQHSLSVFFGEFACQEHGYDLMSQSIADVVQPDLPDTASPLRECSASQQEETIKRKKSRRLCLSDPFIKNSIAIASNRLRRELTAQVLDELRQTFIEGFLENGQFFDLLDSGLVLSNQEKENLVDRVIVTMQDGARLALRPAKHGSISYYWPCVDFYVVQQLGSNWFRVKDKTTRQLVMMKKVSVVSDWQKKLQNFLRLQPDVTVLIPYAVMCDRTGSILYLMQDRAVIGFGRPREIAFDYRKIFKQCVRFLNFCWRCGLHPGDFNSNIAYSRENIYFDPSSLTGLEDLYTFNKSLKAAYSLLLEIGCQALKTHTDALYVCGRMERSNMHFLRDIVCCQSAQGSPKVLSMSKDLATEQGGLPTF
ncbi:uncharacterized protein LOC125461954 isoform X2 [Stegostoma tigrinum]|uniref:uncharacterized protein LOC125461954 isoform X2 n=1 Tax=Stegostoma tigrinum TaxID=3053191 RepID=UPI00202B36F8|nr:uncharacterized protein LOC125461954 isoform X2 [Stegostoma tigrinum]